MYEVGLDIKSQLRVFEQIDEVERRKRDARERDILMRAVKVSCSWIFNRIVLVFFVACNNNSGKFTRRKILKYPRIFTFRQANKGRGSVGRKTTNLKNILNFSHQSRSKQEDPEQARLKEKAKQVPTLLICSLLVIFSNKRK